jgi:mitochondrial chaperone BCS1
MVPGEKPEFDVAGLQSRELSYIPSPQVTYTMWFKGRYMRVTRVRTENTFSRYHDENDSLSVRCVTDLRFNNLHLLIP